MLRQAMAENPYLHTLILGGYFDGGTDFSTGRYTISHLDPSGGLNDRFHFAFFESGHMLYLKDSVRAQAKQELVKFIQTTQAAASATTTSQKAGERGGSLLRLASPRTVGSTGQTHVVRCASVSPERSNFMAEPVPGIDFANLPTPSEGILVTMFITVRKVARSRDFYSRVLGGTVVSDENP